MTVRRWLRGNGYSDIADTIDDIRAELKAKGSKERRNWADVLCAYFGPSGSPISVEVDHLFRSKWITDFGGSGSLSAEVDHPVSGVSAHR